MKTLGAHGRHWHDWDCQRHVNGCHDYPMRRHLIAVFVVTRFVVDIVAVIVVVTLVPLVRFVIMVVISFLVRKSAGLVSPGDQSSSQAELEFRQLTRREARVAVPGRNKRKPKLFGIIEHRSQAMLSGRVEGTI